MRGLLDEDGPASNPLCCINNNNNDLSDATGPIIDQRDYYNEKCTEIEEERSGAPAVFDHITYYYRLYDVANINKAMHELVYRHRMMGFLQREIYWCSWQEQ